MFTSNGISIAIFWFVILMCVEQLTAINNKIDSLHKTSKIASYSRLKSDARLTTDLDKTFNTFKRKDHIGKKNRKTGGKDSKNENTARHFAKKQPQEFSKSRNVYEDNTKRQYIYGLPSAIPSGGLIPRRFVAYSKAGLHTG